MSSDILNSYGSSIDVGLDLISSNNSEFTKDVLFTSSSQNSYTSNNLLFGDNGNSDSEYEYWTECLCV